MGIGGFFRKLGKGALDVIGSEVGGILIGKVVPREWLPIVELARKLVREAEESTSLGGDEQDRERAYREIALEMERQGINYRPSDVNSLIEDVLKEHKGEAIIRE